MISLSASRPSPRFSVSRTTPGLQNRSVQFGQLPTYVLASLFKQHLASVDSCTIPEDFKQVRDVVEAVIGDLAYNQSMAFKYKKHVDKAFHRFAQDHESKASTLEALLIEGSQNATIRACIISALTTDAYMSRFANNPDIRRYEPSKPLLSTLGVPEESGTKG